MKLVIVETPAKGRALAACLGEGWRAEACYGHLRDFPANELGIDTARDFRPIYRLLPGKGSRLRKLASIMHAAEAVYFATDPDVEGEAVAWHLLDAAHLPPEKPVYRITLMALTAADVMKAVENAREMDVKHVEAHTARRIVDRLFSYLVSPLASQALDGEHTVSRLEGFCLRMLVEHEREIASSERETRWSIHGRFELEGQTVDAVLYTLHHGQARLTARKQAEQLRDVLSKAIFSVAKTAQTIRARPPLTPFTTATLFHSAAAELGLKAQATQSLARALYERGAITFPHTASTWVAPEAVDEARLFIRTMYGDDYVLEAPVADMPSDGHEAIRPTDVLLMPDAFDGEGAALYGLIWKRFVASQMAPARYHVGGALIHVGKTLDQPYPVLFRFQQHQLAFDGFLRLHLVPMPDEDRTLAVLSRLETGQRLVPVELRIEANAVPSPVPYTETSLIVELESCGISVGTAIAGLLERGYVCVRDGRLVPTEAGTKLCDYLTAHFGDVLTGDFTLLLEVEFKRIAAGETDRLTVLRGFWTAFQPLVTRATEAMVQTGTAVKLAEQRHE